MKKIVLPEIGNVTIKKLKRSRSMRATLQPDGSFHVTIPYFATYNEAIKFLKYEKSQILKLLEKQKQNFDILYEKYSIGIKYKTKFHTFSLDYYDNNSFFLNIIDEQTYKIFIPKSEDVESNKNQSIIRKLIREIYRYEAKIHIIQKTIDFAQKHNLQFNKITIKNLKTRWGSCSSNNNLNLNLNLMRLPDELIDYVILHELAHLKVHNHKIEFWKFLGTMIQNPKEIDKKLKKYSLSHFAT